MKFALKINGRVTAVDVEPETPLLWVLRDVVGLVGTRFGCGAGLCGACTVHLDGGAVRGCQTPVSNVGAKAITTIEGVGATEIGAKVQNAWIDQDVVQCGYCQAGQIMSATALLSQTATPSETQIASFMAGNICRCATYIRIKAAIRQAAGLDAAPAEAPSAPEVPAAHAPAKTVAKASHAG